MKKAIISRARNGQFFFVLKASNAQVIATSETYTRKGNAIKTAKKNFPQFEIIDHANN